MKTNNHLVLDGTMLLGLIFVAIVCLCVLDLVGANRTVSSFAREVANEATHREIRHTSAFAAKSLPASAEASPIIPAVTSDDPVPSGK